MVAETLCTIASNLSSIFASGAALRSKTTDIEFRCPAVQSISAITALLFFGSISFDEQGASFEVCWNHFANN